MCKQVRAKEELVLTYDMDARGEESLYVYLCRCIRADVERGSIAPDERLPSKRALARHLGVSVITVEAAYAQLLAEGYIYSRPRSGYYACALPQRPAVLPTAPAVTERTAPPTRGSAGASKGASVPCTRGEGAAELIADFGNGSLGSLDDTAALWGRMVRRALVEEPASELFGDAPARGHERLRRAIAAHLRSFRGMEVDPDMVIVGAGAQLFYALLAQLLGPGCVMAVEDPGFSRVARVYEASGLDVRYAQLDGQGLHMADLAASGARACHVMPSHQFPTGTVMSASRRYELLGWAAEEPGRLIVEDDYDCEFRMSGVPVPALASIDAVGSVVYLNTFSKSLSSALRVAYVVLPAGLARRFADELGFYAGTVSTLDQVVLARLIESGDYERHINRVRTRHRGVRDALVGALQASAAGERLRFHGLDAGLHFVLEVEEADSAKIVRSAQERGVLLAPIEGFCAKGGTLAGSNPRFVMQYGSIGAQEAERAAERLADAIEHAML